MLETDRRSLWKVEPVLLDTIGVALIRDVKLNSIVNPIGRNSIAYFNIRRLGKERISELNLANLATIGRFVPNEFLAICQAALSLNVNVDLTHLEQHTVLRNKTIDLKTLTSKSIRDARSQKDPICIYKSGIVNTPAETLSWGYKISKLTNTKLKSTLLRAAHREYYPKERLHRYGLIDSPICPRCNEIDDYDHRLYNCVYVNKIWIETFKFTDRLSTQPVGIDIISKAIGNNKDATVTGLTIHAEILTRILQLRDEVNYLIRPYTFIRLAIEHLSKRETNEEIKQSLKDLLE